jgi:hypothetical protein
MRHKIETRKQAFSKIFRWHPNGSGETPAKVEVAGTFSNWSPLPLSQDVSGNWLVMLENIPGNRTHHYMLLADGKPVSDKYSDGLAVPHGAEEEKFAISTARGPRVFMLFAQTK